MQIDDANDWWIAVDKHWVNLLAIMTKYLPTSDVIDATHKAKFRDNGLERAFQKAWSSAPDNKSIWDNPSWGVLCDLCSESYVLYEGGPEDE